MSTRRNAWATPTRRTRKVSWWSDVDLLVAFVSFFLIFTSIAPPGIGVVFPLAQLAVIGLCVIGSVRRPTRDIGQFGVLFLIAFFFLTYLAVISDYNDVPSADWTRRLIRLTANVMLLFFVASGRLSMKSILVGVGAALLVNLPAFATGVTANHYGGALTGWLGDKNQAGLWYAVIGLLVLSQVKGAGWRFLVFVVFAGALWWTGSRTSLAAYGLGLIWFYLGGRLPMWLRWVTMFGFIQLVGFIEDNFAQAGVFADRAGSDALRARIDAATQFKIDHASFLGEGLGQAYVFMQNDVWYFHNSYWTLRVEGGWIYLGAIVLLTVGLGLRLFNPIRNPQVTLVEASTLGLLMCATRLGEVFLTTVWALVMALALQLRVTERGAKQRNNRTAGMPRQWQRELALREERHGS